MSPAIIPRHEPEVVSAASRPWGGDAEKVATTALKNAVVGGVDLSSRYGKAAELELMAKVVMGLRPAERNMLEAIFCDSKATSSFSVTMAPAPEADVRLVAERVQSLLFDLSGGHNGIDVVSGAYSMFLDAEWVWPSE